MASESALKTNKSVSLPRHMWERIESIAQAESRSRSNMLAVLVQTGLRHRGPNWCAPGGPKTPRKS